MPGAVLPTQASNGIYLLLVSPHALALMRTQHCRPCGSHLVRAVNAKRYGCMAAVQRDASKGADFVLSIAFSPDGKLLACGCMDGSVAVIDVESQSVKSHLVGHFKPVRSVTFTPGVQRSAAYRTHSF